METWPKLFAPKNLRESDLWGEVASIASPNDFKPTIGVFDDKELVLFAAHEHFESSYHFGEDQTFSHVAHIVMYQSQDGGKNWKCRGHIGNNGKPFTGVGEPFVTIIDNVLFLSAGTSLYRSEDKGVTWEEIPFDCKSLGLQEGDLPFPSRNFIKLKDGAIACTVWVIGADRKHGIVLRMTSKDSGKTWEHTVAREEAAFTGGYTHTSMCEAVLFRSPKSDRLMAVSRIVWSRLTEETLAKITHPVKEDKESDIDQTAGMLLMESEDEGLTWKPVRGLGYRGMMYPGVVYCNDSDFILTYTQRVSSTDSPYPHIGVQAILGHENDDGTFDLDFEKDVIIIDDRTPDYSTEGGCYGVTRILPDGTFITPYSYRVNTKELDQKLQDGTFASDETFWHYFETTGMHAHCPHYGIFRDATNDLKKHLIVACFAKERSESRLLTGVLRWGFRLSQ